jgi:D-alanyl-D-alanine carboxypeptidase
MAGFAAQARILVTRRPRAWTWTWLLCGLLVTTAQAAADRLDPESHDAALRARIDSVAFDWLSATDAPSTSIAIVKDGELLYAQAYGAARLAPDAAASPASRYPIDSLTKEFTAAALLLLAERGRVSLDDPLRKWQSGLGAAADVTLRQLLTHTSGIRDYWPQDFVTPEMMRPAAADAIIREWVQRPLDFAPGTEWQYSNTNYLLAATVVQRASHQDYWGFLQQNIFQPLHMNRVTEHTLPVAANDPRGYTRHGLGGVHEAPREGAGWLFGAANLVMTPGDLALWDLSMIRKSLLRPHSYDLAVQPVTLRDGSAAPYGLGLDIEQSRGRLRIGHSGGGSGFLSENRIWPRERAAIVVFTNNDWASPADLLDRIAYLVLAPTSAETRAREVFAELQSGTLDRARFTTTGNFNLTGTAIADLHASLGPLGPAIDMELAGEWKRGGFITRHWYILCRHARLEAIERSQPDGRFEEFLVTQRSN